LYNTLTEAQAEPDAHSARRSGGKPRFNKQPKPTKRSSARDYCKQHTVEITAPRGV
jgi:hypothetical protein